MTCDAQYVPNMPPIQKTQVQIILESFNIFYLDMLFENNQNEKKEAVIGPILKY